MERKGLRAFSEASSALCALCAAGHDPIGGSDPPQDPPVPLSVGIKDHVASHANSVTFIFAVQKRVQKIGLKTCSFGGCGSLTGSTLALLHFAPIHVQVIFLLFFAGCFLS